MCHRVTSSPVERVPKDSAVTDASGEHPQRTQSTEANIDKYLFIIQLIVEPQGQYDNLYKVNQQAITTCQFTKYISAKQDYFRVESMNFDQRLSFLSSREVSKHF
jgi:hypothetical protein